MAASLGLISHLVLSRTMFGRWLYGIGHNPRAAAVSGVPVKKVIVLTYVFSGFCAAMASIIYTSRVDQGRPTLGEPFLLDIIGATVIGGTSLAGGKGKGDLDADRRRLLRASATRSTTWASRPFLHRDVVKGPVILLAARSTWRAAPRAGARERGPVMTRRASSGSRASARPSPESTVRDVDLEVGRGRILGLIGQNGAGKSTLMNIVGGVVRRMRGRCPRRRGRLRRATRATRSGRHRLHPPGS